MNSEGFCIVEVPVAKCQVVCTCSYQRAAWQRAEDGAQVYKRLSIKNALLPKATIRHTWKVPSQVCLAADLLVLATRSSGRFVAQVHQR
jgi:hypothetical protein